MLDLSDSHTHLEDYGDQLPDVVQRARDVGVRRIITAGKFPGVLQGRSTDR